MAATTKISQLRPKSLPITTTTAHCRAASLHYFSSSSSSSSTTPDSNSDSSPEAPPQSQSQSQSKSPHSTFLSAIKDRLKQPQRQSNPEQQLPRKPFYFDSSRPNQPNPPHKTPAIEEIRKNLPEFRRRTVAPPPPLSEAFGSTSAPSGSRPSFSFEEVFNRTAASDTNGAGLSFPDIRKSLRKRFPNPTANRTDESQGSRWTLKSEWAGQTTIPPPSTIGGSDSSLLSSVFGPEIREKDGRDSSDGSMRTEFVKMYDHKELGEKLSWLRPEKKKGDKEDWFSLKELNQRLAKLRQLEERQCESEDRDNSAFGILKESMKKLHEDKPAKGTQTLSSAYSLL